MNSDPSLADTRPVIPAPETISPDTRPIPVPQPSVPDEPHPAGRRSRLAGCLLPILVLGACLALFAISALLPPERANILILGIDQTSPGSAAGRSDTMILTTVRAWEPYMGMLSIPRDLWVSIPGVGEDRINVAHYFSEAANPGSGPAVAIQTVRYNFEVDVHYYVRIQFEGIQDIVDALGGVTIELDQPTGVLPAGRHVLDGRMALIFLRDRRGSDDISRMQRGQLFLRELTKRVLDPRTWPRLPFLLIAILRSIETDLPPWVLAKIAFALIMIGPEGIDARTVGWEMVDSFVTPSGASVLAPDWARINPLVEEMFGP